MDETWNRDEVGTWLDFARSYEEMGDLESVLELLVGVINEGEPDQVEEAKAMLAKYRGPAKSEQEEWLAALALAIASIDNDVAEEWLAAENDAINKERHEVVKGIDPQKYTSIGDLELDSPTFVQDLMAIIKGKYDGSSSGK